MRIFVYDSSGNIAKTSQGLEYELTPGKTYVVGRDLSQNHKTRIANSDDLNYSADLANEDPYVSSFGLLTTIGEKRAMKSHLEIIVEPEVLKLINRGGNGSFRDFIQIHQEGTIIKLSELQKEKVRIELGVNDKSRFYIGIKS